MPAEDTEEIGNQTEHRAGWSSLRANRVRHPLERATGGIGESAYQALQHPNLNACNALAKQACEFRNPERNRMGP